VVQSYKLYVFQILDEVYRILHYIKVTQKLSRPYKVTDELFDLSTMAMEYFKEHIEPMLPEIAYFTTDFLDFTGTFACECSWQSLSCMRQVISYLWMK
jgi:F-box protein 28